MNGEIPKIIHYCWFGGKPLPKTAVKCIESWKKYLPDYEIRRIDETNFNVNQNGYTKAAYEQKKWAFVSDYARFNAIYEAGGVYFDTDVEVIKPLDDIISKGAFMAMENNCRVNPGLGFAAQKEHPFIKEMIDLYDGFTFNTPNDMKTVKTIVDNTTDALIKHGYIFEEKIQTVAGITVYPTDYFSPMDPNFRTLNITKNTCTIHHFDGSWVPKGYKIKSKIQRILGKKVTGFFVSVKHSLRK